MARVLLVEADGDIRSQLVPALERLGHDVTIFKEVATAWQGEVLDHDFDLYVLGGDPDDLSFSACAVACTSCIRAGPFWYCWSGRVPVTASKPSMPEPPLTSQNR
jgi:hypothetical protein